MKTTHNLPIWDADYRIKFVSGEVKIVCPFGQIKHFHYENVSPNYWVTHGKATEQDKLKDFIRGTFVFEDECVMIGRDSPYMKLEHPKTWYLDTFNIEVHYDQQVSVFKHVIIEAPKQIKKTDKYIMDRCYDFTCKQRIDYKEEEWNQKKHV
jgi:hypothetical protein